MIRRETVDLELNKESEGLVQRRRGRKEHVSMGLWALISLNFRKRALCLHFEHWTISEPSPQTALFNLKTMLFQCVFSEESIASLTDLYIQLL